MKFQQLFAKALAIAGLAIAAPAAAEPILLDTGSIGESYTITFDGFVNGGPSIDGLSSSLTLTLTGVDSGIYTFSYSLTNTGSTSDTVGSRVAGFAFNTDPDIVSATSTGTYRYTNTDSNYPNGIGTVDVCFQAQNTGSCSGGGSGGVFDGQSGSGSLSLNFGAAPATLTLDDFFVRYQSVSGVDGVTSASGRQTSTSSSSGGTNVPEPGMVLLFGLGALAIAFGARGRRQEVRPAIGLAYA